MISFLTIDLNPRSTRLTPGHVGCLMLLAQGTSHEHGRGPAPARIDTYNM